MTAFDDLRRMMRIALRAAAFAAVLGVPSAARAQTVTGDVQVESTGGFVRIVLRLKEEVESEVRTAGGIVVVSFKRPVDVGIEKLQLALPKIVGAARRDPDGRGFRIALIHKATVNSMAAGERLFIDLLPETWTGLAPGLPKDVIEQLSRRAREAERALRTHRQTGAKNEKPARVRVATQPTFTRYVFELPDVVAVTSDRGAEQLTLVFAARLKFDFGEVKATPAADRQGDRKLRTERCGLGALRADRKGRCANVPRRPELCRRYRRVGCEGCGRARPSR